MKVAVCSVHNRCLPVLRASFAAYAQGHELVVCGPDGDYPNTANNFGDAYNNLLHRIFADDDACIIANDDIVLKPNSMRLMLEDVEMLKRRVDKLGLVGARSDFVLPEQNIRFPEHDKDRVRFLRWMSETQVRKASIIAPIFAYVSKQAFATAQFPPINWYSDNVICEDLKRAGYHHFVSRSYVHHAGGQTCGLDGRSLIEAAKPWVCANRPEYAKAWF